jgi:hypothetical protein
MTLCVFTAMIEEDANWLDMYLAGLNRLDLPFVMHFDRCSDETKKKVASNQGCCGTTARNKPDREFEESDRQDVLNLVGRMGFDWALALDIDEVLERDAKPKLEVLNASYADVAEVQYWHLYRDFHTVCADSGSGMAGKITRTKGYHVGNGAFTFASPIINRPRFCRNYAVFKSDLVVLHTGFMTPELRAMHRARWTRIYGRFGHNPYGKYEPEREVPLEIVAHDLWPLEIP